MCQFKNIYSSKEEVQCIKMKTSCFHYKCTESQDANLIKTRLNNNFKKRDFSSILRVNSSKSSQNSLTISNFKLTSTVSKIKINERYTLLKLEKQLLVQ